MMASMYWLTHFLTLVAGATIGAVAMAVLQICKIERDNDRRSTR